MDKFAHLNRDQRWNMLGLIHPVNLFDQLANMEKALDFLRQNDWTVLEFDCRELDTQEKLFNAVLLALNSRDVNQYDKNIGLMKFWDLLTGFNLPESNGITLAFKYLDAISQKDRDCVQGLVWAIGSAHNFQLRFRRYFTACAHLEDQSIDFDDLSVKAAIPNKTTHWTRDEIEVWRREWEVKMAELRKLPRPRPRNCPEPANEATP